MKEFVFLLMIIFVFCPVSITAHDHLYGITGIVIKTEQIANTNSTLVCFDEGQVICFENAKNVFSNGEMYEVNYICCPKNRYIITSIKLIELPTKSLFELIPIEDLLPR